MELRQRQHEPSVFEAAKAGASLPSDLKHSGESAPPELATKSHTRSTSSLFLFFLLFRLCNALLTRTFFQPDEYFQSLEIAHKIVFGYGYTTWEWLGMPADPGSSYLASSFHNLAYGPIRSILHPLLFLSGYWMLKITGLDETYLLVLFPRLQQAFFAALGDLFTFKLALRAGGTSVAWFATLVNLSNLYTLYTATRTFSNTTEAAITAVALYYWPFVPCNATFDADTFIDSSKENIHCVWESKDPSLEKRPSVSESDQEFQTSLTRRNVYDRALYRSLWLAALACLLRPTNAVLWIFLVSDLLIKSASSLRTSQAKGKDDTTSITATLQIVAEVGQLLWVVFKVASLTLITSLLVDTTFDYLHNQRPRGSPFHLPLPSLTLISFFYRNVLANLSIFYGQNPWHWYLTQGIPVLCTLWLPATLLGIFNNANTRIKNDPAAKVPKGKFAGPSMALQTSMLQTLARLVCWTVGLYSLLGHKEFRFLQPLLPILAVIAGSTLSDAYDRFGSSSPRSIFAKPKLGSSPIKLLGRAIAVLPLWMRFWILVIQPIAVIYLLTLHCLAQENAPWTIGQVYRQQQQQQQEGRSNNNYDGFGKIESVAWLMPCHSTPWASHLHSEDLVSRSWFITCDPPGSNPALEASTPGSKKSQESKYMDQSDFFYRDPIKYLVRRLPYNVDVRYPISDPKVDYQLDTDQDMEAREEGEEGGGWDLGWRHFWPSHIVCFEELLRTETTKSGHSRTLLNLLTLKGYKEVSRFYNSFAHEDARRKGDVVVLAYHGPGSSFDSVGSASG